MGSAGLPPAHGNPRRCADVWLGPPHIHYDSILLMVPDRLARGAGVQPCCTPRPGSSRRREIVDGSGDTQAGHVGVVYRKRSLVDAVVAQVELFFVRLVYASSVSMVGVVMTPAVSSAWSA